MYAEGVKTAELKRAIAPKGRSSYKPTDFRKFYADGRMGSNPDLATPEHGQQFYEIAVKDLSAGYLEFLKEE